MISLNFNVQIQEREQLEAKIKYVEAKYKEFQQAVTELNEFALSITVHVHRSGS